jgi:signal transduction histidine kinase/CheY-like chemotaxis protein
MTDRVKLLNLEYIIEHSPMAIVVFSDKEIIFANMSALKMLGYNNIDNLKAQIHILRALQVSHGEKVCSIQGRDGKRHEYFLNIIPADSNLEIAYLSRSHNELANSGEEHNEEDLSRSRFIAAMSHELKTPLNSLMNLSAMLRATGLNDDQLEILDMTSLAARNLTQRIDDILDYSNIRTKPISPDMVSFNPQVLLLSIFKKFKALAREKHIGFEYEIDDALDANFTGSPQYAERIVSHLCDNAVKFTNEGKVEVRVTYDETGINFIVKDTGIGIDASVLEHIFDPFRFEKDPTTRRNGGINMGLALSQRMARLLGGEVFITANPEGGTSAKVCLPFERNQENVDDYENECLDILVAEDNPTNQRVINLILSQLGHNVVLTDNGQDCIEKFSIQNFDLILMDLHMPVMNGWEAAKTIRGFNHTLPIFALTADNRPEARILCEEAGMDGFLTKPLMIDQLYEALMVVQEKRHNLAGYGADLKKAVLN